LALPPRRARVWVADAPLLGGDARAVAARVSEELATDGGSAVAIDATLLFTTDEQHEQLAEIARRSDSTERHAWLVARVREALGTRDDRADALLLPPILGLDAGPATSMRAAIAMPLGEVLSDVGGPSALRWSRLVGAVTTRWIAERGDRLAIVDADARAWSVKSGRLAVANGDEIQADSIILATGGVFAGGLTFGDSLRASVAFDDEAIMPVGAEGESIGASSLFGAEGDAWLEPTAPMLMRAGLRGDSTMALRDRFGSRIEGVFVAGDLVAGRARTVGAAIESGLAAAVAALRSRE
ncbi:MAG: hypothetical protein ACHREM_30855, partial [Polyangiales bacterium]